MSSFAHTHTIAWEVSDNALVSESRRLSWVRGSNAATTDASDPTKLPHRSSTCVMMHASLLPVQAHPMPAKLVPEDLLERGSQFVARSILSEIP